MSNMEGLDKIGGDFLPHRALVIYRHDGLDAYYIEEHGVTMRGKKIVYTEGRPLDPESIAGMLEACSTQEVKKLKTGGLIPRNLYYFEQEGPVITMAWVVAAKKQKLLFNTEHGKYQCEIFLPPLLFAVNDGTMYAYCVKSKTQLKETTALYYAPLPNVYENGEVCLGNFQRSQHISTIAEEMAFWEAAFFRTRFNDWHTKKEKVLRGVKDPEKLFSAMDKKNTPFDEQMLVKNTNIKTFYDLLDEL